MRALVLLYYSYMLFPLTVVVGCGCQPQLGHPQLVAARGGVPTVPESRCAAHLDSRTVAEPALSAALLQAGAWPPVSHYNSGQ